MLNKKYYKLAKEIANYFNEINHNAFTKDETKEAIQEYMYMLKNEKYTILQYLKDELEDGSKEVVQLINKVLAF